MSGPWEKYQADDQGPWAKYQAQETEQSAPSQPDTMLNKTANAISGAMNTINMGSGYSGEVNAIEPQGNNMFAKAGGNVAEYLGGKNLPGNPYTAAAVGTAVSMANPENWMVPVAEGRAPLPGSEGFAQTAQEAGRKSLGYTKRFLNKPGAVDKANQVAQTMLDQGVITNPIRHPLSSGSQDMLERAQILNDNSGKAIGDTIESLSGQGKTAFSTAEMADEIQRQLTPKYAGGAYDAENKAVQEILDTVRAHGKGPIDFSNAQALKEKLQELGKFNSNTDQIKANLYRRASGIVRDALDKSITAEGAGQTYLTNKDLYGKSAQAEKALTNRVSSEEGNKNIGLTDTIAAGAEVAAGSPMKAIALVGGKKALERYYHAAKATTYDYLAKTTTGQGIRQAALAAFIDKFTTKDNQR